MTNLPETSEPNKEIGSGQHSTEVDTSQPQPQLLWHRVFACWQIAVAAIITGFLGAGSLIAINLCLMGHRLLAIIVFVPAAILSLAQAAVPPRQKSNVFEGEWRLWFPPLLAYLIARWLFRWEYAPFRKPFAQLSTPPNRTAPLWYAFVSAIASWLMVFVGFLAFALLMDVARLFSPNPAPVENLPILKARALEETETENIGSDQTEFDRKFPK